MEMVPPFWFHQRQAKAEPAGPDTYRLTAPNLKEAFIRIFQGENKLWSGALRLESAGPDVAVTGPIYERAEDALGAAFELYRNYVVIGVPLPATVPE